MRTPAARPPLDPDGLPVGLSHRTGSLLKWQDATPQTLRGPHWARPSHGLIRPAGADLGQPLTRIHDAVALAGPDGVLGGWAGAYVHGVHALDGLDRLGQERPVLVFTPTGQLRRRAGIDPSRTRLQAGEFQQVRDLRVTSLERAIYDEMLRARTLREALVALEAGVSTVTPGARTSLAAMARLVGSHRKTRGIVDARAALHLGCERVASAGETRLRLCALDAGVGSFLVNAPVFGPAGGLVGVVDLLDQEAGLVLEYDGAGHHEADRYAADNAREEALEDLGLVVVRAAAADLASGPDLDRRIRRGQRRGLARRRTHDTWTTVPPPWWAGSRSERRWGWPPWC